MLRHYGSRALRVPVEDEKKLLPVERYLARQARAAHNLGIRQLEHQYNVAYLSLRGWRLENFR